MILLLVRLRSRNSPWMKRAALSTSRSGPGGEREWHSVLSSLCVDNEYTEAAEGLGSFIMRVASGRHGGGIHKYVCTMNTGLDL